MGGLTTEVLAELRRLLDECQPGTVIVNDLRPTHNAIWLDSRYDSNDGWERRRTLAEIDTETETLEAVWTLDDAILIAGALNALPALLDAAAERDTLAAKVEDLECALEGAGVCLECYANGWHKLDCSRRRIDDALDDTEFDKPIPNIENYGG